MWGAWWPGRGEQCSAVHSLCAGSAARRVARRAPSLPPVAFVSLGIELLQWSVVPGRDASLSDVLTNTMGSLVGATLASHRVQLLRPTGADWWRALPAAGVPCGSPFRLGAPSCFSPGHRQTNCGDSGRAGSWDTAHSRVRWFRRVSLGAPIPTDSQPLTPEMALTDPDRTLRPAASPAIRPFGETVLSGRGAGSAGVQWSAIEANGGDLAFQPPMRSSLLRLARPALRIPGALSSPPGSELTLVARDRGFALEAEWTSSGLTQRARQALGPSLGWSLLAPFRHTYGRGTSVITLVWLAAWLLPLGYWTPHVSGRPFLSWGAVLLLVALGVGLVPLLTGYAPARFSEWLGALLGLAAGAAGYSGHDLF